MEGMKRIRGYALCCLESFLDSALRIPKSAFELTYFFIDDPGAFFRCLPRSLYMQTHEKCQF